MNRTVRLAVACASSLIGLLLVPQSFAQSGAIIPEHGAGHANQASCIILKRMGPADQVTSRLYSFGIRGKQFQYVEGKLPDGFPFHGRLTDHDVRNLQSRGAEVIIVNQNYSTDELNQARSDCRGETGTTPIQAESKPAPTAAPATSATSAAPAATDQARLQISSTPDGADIEIDGNYIGNTPSTVGVAAGPHQISIKKTGFKPWERKISVSTGQVNVNATLEAEAK
jgi:hypothetical protein